MTDDDTIYAKVVSVTNGYPGDAKSASENFTLGQVIEVADVRVGGWSSSVSLVGYDESFNSVHFEFYRNGELYDVYNDPNFSDYI